MNASTILLTLGCIVSGVTGLLSFISAKRNWEARRHLVERLSHDHYFVRLADAYSNIPKANEEATEEKLIALRRRIEEATGLLNDPVRVRIQSGLFQPSYLGRKRYVEKIAEDVKISTADLSAHSPSHSAFGC